MHDAYILFKIFNKNTAAEVSTIKLILNVEFQKFCAPENVTVKPVLSGIIKCY